LAQVLRHVPVATDPRILVDASSRDDAAVFRLTPDRAIVASVDFFTPIVDDAYTFGRIAATNAFSDIYAMGATPLFALNLVGWPREGLPFDLLGEVLRGGADTTRAAGAFLLGGHSVDDPEPKYGMAVIGEVHPDRIVTNAGARAGDALVLTKPLGTGILSTALKQESLDAPLLRRLTRLMTALNRGPAEAAVEFGARAATDVTGYGLLGHVCQMAEASGVSIRLAPSPRWFLPRVLELAAAGVKPAGLDRNREFYGPKVAAGTCGPAMVDGLYDPQTSGGLLIAVPPKRLGALFGSLRRRRVWNAVVGEAVARGGRAVELRPA